MSTSVAGRTKLRLGHKVVLRDASSRHGGLVVSTNNQLRQLGVQQEDALQFEDAVFVIASGEDIEMKEETLARGGNGEPVLFGSVIRLLHCTTASLVCESRRTRASLEKQHHRVTLERLPSSAAAGDSSSSAPSHRHHAAGSGSELSLSSRFLVTARYKTRSEGQYVLSGDVLCLKSLTGDTYLHCASQQLRDGATGKAMEPFFELNSAAVATGFEIRAYDTSASIGRAGYELSNYISCGDCLLLVSREERAAVSSIGFGDVCMTPTKQAGNTAAASAGAVAGEAGSGASAAAVDIFDSSASSGSRSAHNFPSASLFTIEHENRLQGGKIFFGRGGRYRLKSLLNNLYLCVKRHDELEAVELSARDAAIKEQHDRLQQQQQQHGSPSSAFRQQTSASFMGDAVASGGVHDHHVASAHGAMLDDILDIDRTYCFWLCADPCPETVVCLHQAADDTSPVARNLSRIFLEFPLAAEGRGIYFATGAPVTSFPIHKHVAAATQRERLLKINQDDPSLLSSAHHPRATSGVFSSSDSASTSDFAAGLESVDMAMYKGAKELLCARALSQRDGLELLKTPSEVYQQLNMVRSLIPPFGRLRTELHKFNRSMKSDPYSMLGAGGGGPPQHLVEQVRENLIQLILHCTRSQEMDPLIREGTPDFSNQSRIAEQNIFSLLLDIVDLSLEGPLAANQFVASPADTATAAAGLPSALAPTAGAAPAAGEHPPMDVLAGLAAGSNSQQHLAMAVTHRRDRGIGMLDTQHNFLNTTVVYSLLNLQNALTTVVKLVFRLFRQVALQNTRTCEALAPQLPRLMSYAKLSRLGVKEALYVIFDDCPSITDTPTSVAYLRRVIQFVCEEGRGSGGSTRLLTALTMCKGRGIRHAQTEVGQAILAPAVDELVNSNRLPEETRPWKMAAPFFKLWVFDDDEIATAAASSRSDKNQDEADEESEEDEEEEEEEEAADNEEDDAVADASSNKSPQIVIKSALSSGKDNNNGNRKKQQRSTQSRVMIDLHDLNSIFGRHAASNENVFAQLQKTETRAGVPLETFCMIVDKNTKKRAGGEHPTSVGSNKSDDGADRRSAAAAAATTTVKKKGEQMSHVQGLARQFMLMAALCADRHEDNIRLCRQLVPIEVLIRIIRIEKFPGTLRAQAFNLMTACYIAVVRKDVLEEIKSCTHVMDSTQRAKRIESTKDKDNKSSDDGGEDENRSKGEGNSNNNDNSNNKPVDSPASAADAVAAALGARGTSGSSLSATTRVALDTVNLVDTSKHNRFFSSPASSPRVVDAVVVAAAVAALQQQQKQEQQQQQQTRQEAEDEAERQRIEMLILRHAIPATRSYLRRNAAIHIADRSENECTTFAVRCVSAMCRFGYITAAAEKQSTRFYGWLEVLRACADGRDDVPPPGASRDWMDKERFAYDEQNQIVMQMKLVTMQTLSIFARIIRADIVDRLVASFERGDAAVLPFVSDVTDFRPRSRIHELSLQRAVMRERRDQRLREQAERDKAQKDGGIFSAQMKDLASGVLGVGKDVLDAVGVGKAMRKIGSLFSSDDDANFISELRASLSSLIETLLDNMRYAYEPVVAAAAELLMDLTNTSAALEPMLRRVQILPQENVSFYHTIKPLQLDLSRFEHTPVSIPHVALITETIRGLAALLKQREEAGDSGAIPAHHSPCSNHDRRQLFSSPERESEQVQRRARKRESVTIMANMRLHTIVASIIEQAPIQQEIQDQMQQQFTAGAASTSQNNGGGAAQQNKSAAASQTPVTTMLIACFEFLMLMLPETEVQSDLLPFITTFASFTSIGALTHIICQVFVLCFTGRLDLCTSVSESVIQDIASILALAPELPIVPHVLRLLVFQEDQVTFDLVQGNAEPVLRALLETEGVSGLLRCNDMFTGKGAKKVAPMLVDASEFIQATNPQGLRLGGEMMARYELLNIVICCLQSSTISAEMKAEARLALFGADSTALFDELPAALEHPSCISVLFLILYRILFLEDRSVCLGFVENPNTLRILRRVDDRLRRMLGRIATMIAEADEVDDEEVNDSRSNTVFIKVDGATLRNGQKQQPSSSAAAAAASASQHQQQHQQQMGDVDRDDPRSALFSTEMDWLWLSRGVVPFVQSLLRVFSADGEGESASSAAFTNQIKVAPEVHDRLTSVVQSLYQLFDVALRENVNYDVAKAASELRFSKLQADPQHARPRSSDSDERRRVAAAAAASTKPMFRGSSADSQDGNRDHLVIAPTPRRHLLSSGTGHDSDDLVAAAMAAVAAADSQPDAIEMSAGRDANRSLNGTSSASASVIANPLSAAIGASNNNTNSSVKNVNDDDEAASPHAGSSLSLKRKTSGVVRVTVKRQEGAAVACEQQRSQQHPPPLASADLASPADDDNSKKRGSRQGARSAHALQPLPLMLRSTSLLFFMDRAAFDGRFVVTVRRLPAVTIHSLLDVIKTAFRLGRMNFLRSHDFVEFDDVLSRLDNQQQTQQQQQQQQQELGGNSDGGRPHGGNVFHEWKTAVNVWLATQDGTREETAYLTTARLLLRSPLGHHAVWSLVRIVESQQAVSERSRARILTVLRQVIVATPEPLGDAALIIPNAANFHVGHYDSDDDDDDDDGKGAGGDEADGSGEKKEEGNGRRRGTVGSSGGDAAVADDDDDDAMLLSMQDYGSEDKDTMSLGLKPDERRDLLAAWGSPKNGGIDCSLGPKLARIIASPNCRTVLEALRCGCALLDGGHRANQELIYQFFLATSREDFFVVSRRILVAAAATVRDRRRTLRRWIDELSGGLEKSNKRRHKNRQISSSNTTNNRGASSETTATVAEREAADAASKADDGSGSLAQVQTTSRSFATAVESMKLIESIYDFTLPETLLRMHQLLCEGHFTPLQTMLHVQADNQVSIDLLFQYLALLDELASSVDQSTFPLFMQLIATITETLQGTQGYLGNHQFYVQGGIGNIITQIFAAEHALLLVEQRAQMYGACVTLLHALLEGHLDVKIYTTLVNSLDLGRMIKIQDAQYVVWRKQRDKPFGSAENDEYAMAAAEEEEEEEENDESDRSSSSDDDSDAGSSSGGKKKKKKKKKMNKKKQKRDEKSRRITAHVTKLAGKSLSAGLNMGKDLLDSLFLGHDHSSDDELQDDLKLACDIFILLRMLLGITTLIPPTEEELMIVDRTGRNMVQLFQSSRSYKALNEIVASVEICNRIGNIEVVYFRKPAVISQLNDEIKDRVLMEVDNSGDAARVSNFLELCENRLLLQLDFFDEMSRTRLLSIIYKYKSQLDTLALLVILALNLLLLIGVDVGNSDISIVSHLPASFDQPFSVLAIAVVVLQSALATNFIFAELRIFVHESWARWQDDRNRARIARSKAALGIEQPRLETGSPSKGLSWPVAALWSCYFTLTYGETWRHIVFLGFAYGGLLWHPGLFCLLLLQIVFRSQTLINVIQAVTKNGRSLLLTLALLLMLLYIFAVIGYYNFADVFPEDGFGAGACDTLSMCYFTVTLRGGMLAGGGTGDVAGPVLYPSSSNPRHFNQWVARNVFQIAFFVILILLALQLLFGQILDTFSQLRGEKDELEAAMTGRCFVCGVERSVLDREMGFEMHIAHTGSHNMWNYLAFFKYLRLKPKEELTGPESFTVECIERASPAFFPIGRTLFSEVRKKYEEGAAVASSGGQDEIENSNNSSNNNNEQERPEQESLQPATSVDDVSAMPMARRSSSSAAEPSAATAQIAGKVNEMERKMNQLSVQMSKLEKLLEKLVEKQ